MTNDAHVTVPVRVVDAAWAPAFAAMQALTLALCAVDPGNDEVHQMADLLHRTMRDARQAMGGAR